MTGKAAPCAPVSTALGNSHAWTGRWVFGANNCHLRQTRKKKPLTEPNSYLGGKTTYSLETELSYPSSCTSLFREARDVKTRFT